MTQNSLIIAEWGEYNGERGPLLRMESHGCSEFIGINNRVIRAVSLAFNMFTNDDSKYITDMHRINKDYTLLSFMEDWVKFVYSAFECMNISDKPFVTLYRWADFKNEYPRFTVKTSPFYVISPSANTITITNTTQVYNMSDETIIGIQVDCVAMRKCFGCNYWENGGIKSVSAPSGLDINRCRKIQLPHTALRYAWSGAKDIALIAMKLMHLDNSLDPFYVLQVANNLRSNVTNNTYVDYGTLYESNNQIVSRNMFMMFYRDKMKQSVTQHFIKTSDPMLTMLTESSQVTTRGVNTKCKSLIALLNNDDPDLIGNVRTLIEISTSDKGVDDLKVKFKFVSTIFRTTVKKMTYDGYRKKGTKIDRILFRDEEGTILSIAEKSKLIEII